MAYAPGCYADRAELSGLCRVVARYGGLYADLTVFSPESVVDRATFSEPRLYPEGIHHVIVNGVLAASGGVAMGNCPGRYLSSRRDAPGKGA